MLLLTLDHVMHLSEGGSCRFCTCVETESEKQFVIRCGNQSTIEEGGMQRKWQMRFSVPERGY